ncbi:MAG: alpha-glucosidase, partial [Pseudomonadota bacterium]
NLGRDGSRTPMPWQHATPHGGFSMVPPWLPVPESHRMLAVDRQEADDGSLLQHTRKMIALRQGSSALRLGSIDFIETPDPVIGFWRIDQSEAVLCLFNLGEKPMEIDLPPGLTPLDIGLRYAVKDNQLCLPSFGGIILSKVE